MSSFKTCCRILLAHRLYIIIYLGVVMATAIAIGFGVSDARTDGAYEPTRASVAVIDRDGSVLSAALARHVADGNDLVPLDDDRRALQDAVARDRVSYLLVIPGGWGDGLMAAAADGADAPELLASTSYSSAAGALVAVEATSYAQGLYGFAATTGGSQDEVVAATDASWAGTVPARYAVTETSAFPQSLRSVLEFATYPLFAGISVCIAVLMASLNARPVRSRVLASPQTGRSRGAALFGACLAMAAVAWALITTASLALFGVGSGALSPIQYVLLAAATLTFSLVCASFGFLFGQLGISENAANALGNVCGMAFSILGGAWMSVALLPDALKAVGRLTPALWYTEAIEGVASLGDLAPASQTPQLQAVLLDLGVCLAFAVAVLLVGLVIGRSRAEREI
ncbi:ABC transporter permease [bacterium]|nr:ABC transporter permease [bacterium]